MKTSQKGSVVVLLSIIIILLVIVAGFYIYYENNPSQTSIVNLGQTEATSSKSTIDSGINLTTYLPGKIFISTFASGEMGIFNADHTLTLKWGNDYVGPNDPRPNSETGSWTVVNNILTIKGSTLSDGSYDPRTLNQTKVGNEIVIGTWSPLSDSDQRLSGFFIGKDLATIGTLTDVSFFKSLNNSSNL